MPRRAAAIMPTLWFLLLCPTGADELRLLPTEVQLAGQRAQQRLLVSRIDAHGLQADVTGEVEYESLDPAIATVSPAGLIQPRATGKTQIIAWTGELYAAVPVAVSDIELSSAIDFQNEVIPALSRGGCNQGACHGSPQGKNGFRLSLRGFDPTLDLLTLTREGGARRLNRLAPDASLILQKASGRVAHGGGLRLRESDEAYQRLLRWIKEGNATRTDSPRFRQLELLPRRARLHPSSPHQQIVAVAHFDDGSVLDVTDLAVFTSANEQSAQVSASGLVSFDGSAEAAILVRYLDRIETVRLSYVDVDPEFRFVSPPPANYVDRLVFAKQQELQLRPAELADDPTFLRRVYLDLIGAIPTPDEARRFLLSDAPDKRERLINELLERDEYSQFWALKWADVMRGNRETISERGVHNFHRYLVRNLDADRSFDEVAREILTSLGNTIHEPAANFFRVSRTPTDAAESFSQLFLGVRIQCAKCHNHPYESITQQDYYGLAASFARVSIKGTRFGLDDEIVLLSSTGEVKMPGADDKLAPTAFGHALDGNSADTDRRVHLASWLTSADNPFFARSTVNRIWYHLLGQGLVDPVDDFRESNPPSNPELLDALADDFAQHGFRFKPVIRSILNSRTYQLAAQLDEPQSARAADEQRYFTRAHVQLLRAEQIIDAISTATGVAEEFPGYPSGTRAIALAEGSIDHKFLQAFSRPVRDVACDCARETDPTLNQVIHLLNNPSILDKLDSAQNRLARGLAETRSTAELIELLYLATLSRFPTRDEIQFCRGHLTTSDGTAAGLSDLQHALINSNEFLLRH